MAIEYTHSTIYICDRCGHRTTNPYDKNAQTTMTIRLQQAAVALNGDVGGAVTNKWLCGDCSRDFEQFMKH